MTVGKCFEVQVPLDILGQATYFLSSEEKDLHHCTSLLLDTDFFLASVFEICDRSLSVSIILPHIVNFSITQYK